MNLLIDYYILFQFRSEIYVYIYIYVCMLIVLSIDVENVEEFFQFLIKMIDYFAIIIRLQNSVLLDFVDCQ